MNKHLRLVALFYLFVTSASAELAEVSAQASFIIECTDLNFEKYRVLHENVQADGHFTIETACIPANVLCIKPNDMQASIEGFKQLVTLSGIQMAASRNNLTRAEFDLRCANARTGN